jgi:hypothetical protein
MDEMTKLTVNAATGEETIEPLTPDEIAAFEALAEQQAETL